MKSYQKWFYKLTAFVPRKLPATEQEYEFLKSVFRDAYGVPNQPAHWATVASHLGSVPSFKLRFAWGKIANTAKRLNINKIIQDQKVKEITLLQEQLQKAVDESAKEEQKNTLEELT